MGPQPPKVIAVVGPTATGKTALGVQLALALGSEVISCDSQLVYQGLNIGVAKPTVSEMQGITHHMIDVCTPAQKFSAGDYAEQSRPHLEALLTQGKSPVLVGGTGFYLRALLQPDHLPPTPHDPLLRAKLRERLETDGLPALYAELKTLDPKRALAIYPQDAVRVIRALEINLLTGKPVPQTSQESIYPLAAIGLTYCNREQHLQVIQQRLFEMVDAGFLAEVEALYQQYGLCPALQTAHGYPELVQVLEGERTLEDALVQINLNIRQYSKRQMTWFRKLQGIRWFEVDTMSQADMLAEVLDGL